MDPKQALEILDKVTAQIPLVRSDQASVLQAISVLQKMIEQSKETKE